MYVPAEIYGRVCVSFSSLFSNMVERFKTTFVFPSWVCYVLKLNFLHDYRAFQMFRFLFCDFSKLSKCLSYLKP